MSSPPLHPEENLRLAALQSYQILDTLEEKDFDDLTALAAAICQVPIALISLVDQKRQWFKSHKGLAISETPVELSFCAHAIVSTDAITIIEDAHKDSRFKANPFVTGEPYITFYAGVPLINNEGFPLGTLCVADPNHKKLTAEQEEALKILARQVMDKLELRRKVQALESANEALKQSEQKIKKLNTDLSLSTNRTKTFIEQAPVSMIVFRGSDLLIEAVNPPMLQLLNKQSYILNKPLLEAIPELINQPAYQLLHHVYKTGEPLYGYDTPVVLTRNGKPETGYYNFSYTPLLEDGAVTGVIDMAVEVTGQVTARRELESAQDKMNMALDSARLGVWNADMGSGTLTVSERARFMHGIPENFKITLAEAIQLIPEEHRKRVVKSIEQAMLNQGHFDEEYPVNPMDGGPQRWLKSNGKIYYNEQRIPLNITGTILDITEQKQDEQRKDDFISMVSHELKTPLTSMSGYIQLLLAKAKKNENNFATNVLEKTYKQVNKMTTMINGFLNVSRLESGKIHIDKQRFDLAILVKESEEETLATISSHEIIFHPVVTTYVHADKDKIGYVINNLVSNAIKYAPAGSTIQVACLTIDGMAQVSVEDKGMGISQQDISKLFERYYRVEGSHMKSIAGFGIGLYLCAEIIQRHKGKIWVESEVGAGSTFYFSLPVIE